MHSNVNLESVVGALGLLGAAFVLALLGLVFAHALLRRRRGRARAALAAGLCVAGLYVALTLAFSLASTEEVLAGGAEKYFCELDCHLAYSVAGVRRAPALGGARAAGEFWVVTLRTRFDETTTSHGRGDRPLNPNPRRVEVFDEERRAYGPSEEGARSLAEAGAAGTPLDTPLRPGESYTTQLVFDLPAGVRRPVLLVSESTAATRFIIGHENSLLHRKTKFRLDP